jgi:hypothetical protein
MLSATECFPPPDPVSDPPPAKKTAGQIEKETHERRTLNVQHRILYFGSREPFVERPVVSFCVEWSVLKKISRSDSIIRSASGGSIFICHFM